MKCCVHHLDLNRILQNVLGGKQSTGIQICRICKNWFLCEMGLSIDHDHGFQSFVTLQSFLWVKVLSMFYQDQQLFGSLVFRKRILGYRFFCLEGSFWIDNRNVVRRKKNSSHIQRRKSNLPKFYQSVFLLFSLFIWIQICSKRIRSQLRWFVLNIFLGVLHFVVFKLITSETFSLRMKD